MGADFVAASPQRYVAHLRVRPEEAPPSAVWGLLEALLATLAQAGLVFVLPGPSVALAMGPTSASMRLS